MKQDDPDLFEALKHFGCKYFSYAGHEEGSIPMRMKWDGKMRAVR